MYKIYFMLYIVFNTLKPSHILSKVDLAGHNELHLNPSTLEAEAVRTMSCRIAWST